MAAPAICGIIEPSGWGKSVVELPALVTFRELLAATRVSSRKLRSIIRELGYRPPVLGQRLLFTIEDAKHIQEAIACRLYQKAPASPASPARIMTRSEKIRETKRLADPLRTSDAQGPK